MTVTSPSSSSGTGPVIDDELRALTPAPWSAPPRSEPRPALSDDVMKRAQQVSKQLGVRSAQRTVLLGLLLAELDGVPFEDIARLLDVKPKPLQLMMHGEKQIPSGREERWQSLAELLHNLHRVLRSEATQRWLHTNIPDLDGRTPMETIARGRVARVLALTRSYLDPSFS